LLAGGDPPEQMAGPVAVDAEVDGGERLEALGPDLLAVALPALGDRVAQEDHVHVPLAGAGGEFLVAVGPPSFLRTARRRLGGWNDGLRVRGVRLHPEAGEQAGSEQGAGQQDPGQQGGSATAWTGGGHHDTRTGRFGGGFRKCLSTVRWNA